MKTSRLMAALALLMALSRPGLAEESPSVAATHAQLTQLLEGEPVVGKGTPILCSLRGSGPQSVAITRESYFGAGACDVLMRPDPSAVITPFTDGAVQRFYDEPALREQLDELLVSLHDQIIHRPPTPEQRLVLQSTAWEITYALIRDLKFDPEGRDVMGPLICRGLDLVKRSGYSKEMLAELAETRNVEPLLTRRLAELHAESSGFVEVVPPTDLHADGLRGRFTARIFLAARGLQRSELLKALRAASYEQLYELPLIYPDLRAVLVLYFNVVTPELKIAPSDRVAAWREYSFAGRTSYKDSFEVALERINFRMVESAWQHGDDGPSITYSEADLNAATHETFPGVKPTVPGSGITTLRAYCAKCHLNRVVTLSTKGPRLVELDVSFARPHSELVTAFFQRYEKDLADWDRECQKKR